MHGRDLKRKHPHPSPLKSLIKPAEPGYIWGSSRLADDLIQSTCAALVGTLKPPPTDLFAIAADAAPLHRLHFRRPTARWSTNHRESGSAAHVSRFSASGGHLHRDHLQRSTFLLHRSYAVSLFGQACPMGNSPKLVPGGSGMRVPLITALSGQPDHPSSQNLFSMQRPPVITMGASPPRAAQALIAIAMGLGGPDTSDSREGRGKLPGTRHLTKLAGARRNAFGNVVRGRRPPAQYFSR